MFLEKGVLVCLGMSMSGTSDSRRGAKLRVREERYKTIRDRWHVCSGSSLPFDTLIDGPDYVSMGNWLELHSDKQGMER